MSDASFDKAALPQPIGISTDEILNAAGDLVGDLENILHHPLYPIAPAVFVVNERLLRGSWPSAEVLETLATCGVEAVVNLCSERGQDDAVVAARMVSVRDPIDDNDVPSSDAVSVFLAVVSHYPRTYVHCEAGKGRTGCMIAAYRVMCCNWTPEQALKEATRHGLVMPRQRAWILHLG